MPDSRVLEGPLKQPLVTSYLQYMPPWDNTCVGLRMQPNMPLCLCTCFSRAAQKA